MFPTAPQVEDPPDSHGQCDGSTNGVAPPTNAFEGNGHHNLDRPFRSQTAVNSLTALAVDNHGPCSHSTRYAYLWSTCAVRNFYKGCSPDHNHTAQKLLSAKSSLAVAVLSAAVLAAMLTVSVACILWHDGCNTTFS